MLGKVLVVDDEQNECSALAELLRDDGYVVETAADGLAALAKLDPFRPDVVIIDLQMPMIDGTDLVTRLSLHATQPCVVVMTEYGKTTAALAALRAGARDYLIKPIRFDELAVVLGRVMELAGSVHDGLSCRRHEPHDQGPRTPRSP
jgi:two-component system response regulator HydG